jgi:hypothetical protein
MSHALSVILSQNDPRLRNAFPFATEIKDGGKKKIFFHDRGKKITIFSC